MLIRFYFFNCFVKETFKLNFKHAIRHRIELYVRRDTEWTGRLVYHLTYTLVHTKPVKPS